MMAFVFIGAVLGAAIGAVLYLASLAGPDDACAKAELDKERLLAWAAKQQTMKGKP